MSYNKIRSRTFQIIEKGEDGDKLSIFFDYFIVILITLNVVAIILETFHSIRIRFALPFKIFELFSVIIFTCEYLLRLWTADLKIKKKYFVSVILYIFTPMALIDLFAILPFYLPFLIPLDLRFLRILRLTRLFRLLKINRYSKSLNMIGTVLKKKKEELLVTIFVVFLLLLLASTMMFYIENEVQPESFKNIFQSFWWAVATLTTVGYGDVYPISGFGKLLSGAIALLGIGLVALPTGIISSGFMEEIGKKDKKEKCNCPHCGKPIE